ncbi:MAG TPA: hypothetical protein VHC22_15720 [Pirellulales bacterium]|nr:hypothetical protein [Pirellulales bacterium]
MLAALTRLGNGNQNQNPKVTGKSRPTRLVSVGVGGGIAFVVALLLYVLALRPYLEGQRLVAERLAEGRQIVEAANAFQRSNGRWPGTMRELVPEYLPILPANQNWSYTTIETGPPVLSGDAGLGRRLMYGFPPRKASLFAPGTDHGWIIESRDGESFIATD